jgi:ABC-2 type transport system ATP-binding protein
VNIDIENLTVRFGQTVAVDEVSLHLAQGKVYGLLGRNGAGKTTLLSVLAAFRRASAGRVLVEGASPFENAGIAERICFVRDRLDAQDSERVRAVLDTARRLRPAWDQPYAERLVQRFAVPLRRKVSELSRGQKSAVSIVIGLATRAPLTIMDESYLGLDAPSRYAFYEELLNDYLAHRRTLILSTHLIEEVGSLFEEVIILDQGRLVLHEETDALRARGAAVTGPAEAVDRFVEGLTVLSEQRLGPTKSAMVYGRLGPERAIAARTLDLELGPVGLQDLFVHLTRPDAIRPGTEGTPAASAAQATEKETTR